MRKVLLLATAVLIGAGLVVWLWPKGTTGNLGGFSKEDFTQIQEEVWRAVRQGAAPSASLSKTNPSAAMLGLLATGRILYVEPYPPRKGLDPNPVPSETAHVRARFLFGDRYFLVRKQPDLGGVAGWRVVAQSSSSLAYPKPVIVRVVSSSQPPPDEATRGETNKPVVPRTEHEFSDWLSKSAELKLGR